MDKKSFLAIGIITVIILLLPSYYQWINDQPEQSYKPDTTFSEEKNQADIIEPAPLDSVISSDRKPEAVTAADEQKLIVQQKISEENIFVETPYISAIISNRGGGKIVSWHLKKYKKGENGFVQIVNEQMQNGPTIRFITVDGIYLDLNDYIFELKDVKKQTINLQENDKITLSYDLNIKDSKIVKKVTLFGDRYHIDVDITIENSQQLILNNDYEIGWENGLPSNEQNIVDDYSYSDAYASMGGEIETFSIDSEDPVEDKTYNGKTDWIGVRTKYFLSAIIPKDVNTTGITFSGEGIKSGEAVIKKYDPRINVNYNNSGMDRYQIYMGPLDHAVLKSYESGIDDIIMRHGWYEKAFRSISLPILSLLKFFYMFIPNYGVVIIVFSILVKIVVYPLTKKSYKSMKEMSRVQPLLAELREKYKSDPQRLNKETMKLYKEHGINPLGGCLPMLLQLPLLGALFIVFRSTIQLRGASFIPGWINDLSRPDTLFTLPFSLPLYGDQFNLLPILMAGSMILQSKMTMQDPKQKAMVYIMPIFMLLLFNQFPSGLNLYYTLFNVLTIIQQKVTDNKGALEAVPAGGGKPKKKK